MSLKGKWRIVDWQDNDERDKASRDGSAQLQEVGSLAGEIRFHNADNSTFIARPWTTSSTAC